MAQYQQVPPREWRYKPTDCCTPFKTFCMAYWCPCFLVGKIRHRLDNGNDMTKYQSCNSQCWLFCGLGCIGLPWIVEMEQRREMREVYNLQGDCTEDCLCAYCCFPCDLVQQDKESHFREEENPRNRQVVDNAYVPSAQPMTYPEPVVEKPPVPTY